MNLTSILSALVVMLAILSGHASSLIITSNDPKYDFAATLMPSKLRLLWRVLIHDDVTNEKLIPPKIRIKLEASEDNVWLGFGLSVFKNHDNQTAQAVVVMSNGTSCGLFALSNQTTYDPIPSDEGFSCSSYTEGRLLTDGSSGRSLEFTTASLGGKDLSLDSVNGNTTRIIFAYGPGVVPLAHTFAGSADIDWTQSGLDYVYSVLRVTHAVLMVFAWVVLFPLGIMMPTLFKPAIKTRIKSVRVRDQWNKRFGNDPHELPAKSFLVRKLGKFRWLEAHKGLNVTGLIIAAIAFACIVPTVSVHFRGIHHILGLVVMVIITVQPILARFRPHDTDFIKSNARLRWEIVHKNTGRAVFAIAFTNCFIGSGLYARFLTPVMGSEVFVYSFFFLLTLPACIIWGGLYIVVNLARKGKITLPPMFGQATTVSNANESEGSDNDDSPVVVPAVGH